MIYLDNAATTKPTKEALETFSHYASECFFNPSSVYLPAMLIAKDLNEARAGILKMLGDVSGNLIFTSGATEANNQALFQATKYKNKTILISAGEHPSVYTYAMQLKSSGYPVQEINLLQDGTVDLIHLEKLLKENDVGFVSIMHVNNETGALNDINAIGSLIKHITPQAVFHVDAVQSFCKLNFSVREAKIDLCTISSHKIHGIKGTGGLYYKDIYLKPFITGGGQEFDKRSGTENTAGILAFYAACKEKYAKIENNLKAVQKIKQRAIELITKANADVVVNANIKSANPYILSISKPGVKSEVVVREMEKEGIYIATGSACSSKKADNRVLSAMGISRKSIEGTNRFSFASNTTLTEIETAIAAYIKIIKQLEEI